MDLPQELIDKIIDAVWDADDSQSHTTTKAASFISRPWVDRSQHHLFHSVQFSSVGDQFGRWCNVVTPGPNGVSRHIRSLTIQARGLDGWWINEDSLEQALPYFNSFRSVQILRVLNWNVEPFPPEMLARCFTPFAGDIRLLQWDPHQHTTRQAWIRIVELFPSVDHLLLHPGTLPTGLLFDAPAGSVRKKLFFSGSHAANCLIERNLRFQEIHMRCTTLTLETVVAVLSCDADRLEILSLIGIRGVINPSNANTFTSFLGDCRALRELSIDWFPMELAPELHLIDAIPGGCIQSLRIMPVRSIWEHMWNKYIPDTATQWLSVSHERLAQAILRLGARFSSKFPGRKISVWLVIPRAPYVVCDPIKNPMIALWEAVEGVVSGGFQMTEAEFQNVDESGLIPSLEP